MSISSHSKSIEPLTNISFFFSFFAAKLEGGLFLTHLREGGGLPRKRWMQNSIPHGVFMQKSTKLLLYHLYTTPLALQKSTSTITTTKHNTVLWICTIYYYIASTILLFCYIHCTVSDFADILLFFKGLLNQLVIRVSF